ncbi:MAG: hypothetical protein N2043_01535 [Ignavibacterium sp.]|nr:hypothetical protein [Ignavibacterium sp.]
MEQNKLPEELQQQERLQELSPIIKDIFETITKDEYDKFKVVDIIEAQSLASGIMVVTALNEDAVMRAEDEGEKIFNYLMKGIKQYIDKKNVLHASILLGLLKTLGFLANYISEVEKKKGENTDE